jgi:hypothetical protein
MDMETDKLCHRTKQEIKRQRTSSRSPSASPVLESEDDSTKASAPKQKPRGAAARSHLQKEQREKDRDKERTEAANRRKGRAERRKGDGMFTECTIQNMADRRQKTKLLSPHLHLRRTKSLSCLPLWPNPRLPRRLPLNRNHRLPHEEAADHHKKRADGLVEISTHEILCRLPTALHPPTLHTRLNQVLQMA